MRRYIVAQSYVLPAASAPNVSDIFIGTASAESLERRNDAGVEQRLQREGADALAKRSMKTSPMVFISYRRDDTGGDAGRLKDTLNQLLGPDRTFFDIDQIAPGMDFEVELKRRLSASEVLLALIGPKWETVSDSSGKPRLSDKTISFESRCSQL